MLKYFSTFSLTSFLYNPSCSMQGNHVFISCSRAVRSVRQRLGFSPSANVTWVGLPGLTTSESPWLLKICVGYMSLAAYKYSFPQSLRKPNQPTKKNPSYYSPISHHCYSYCTMNIIFTSLHIIWGKNLQDQFIGLIYGETNSLCQGL